MSVDMPKAIESYVRDYVRQRRWFALAKSGGAAAGFGLAWMLGACLLDRMLQLPAWARWTMVAMDIGGISAILARPLARLLRRQFDWLAAAAEVEQRDKAFAERLRTVVSQLTGRPEHRGSPAMLAQLVQETCAHAGDGRHGRWFSLAQLAPAWNSAGMLAVVLAGLSFVPLLGLPTLMKRFAWPASGTDPVTTTRITLEPRSVTLVGRGDVTIHASVERLRGSAVDIFTSQNGGSWSRVPMLPVSEGQYVLSVPGLDRDLYYYVRAGDATTEVCKVTVLRPPAVAEYRIRYDYPSYTERNPLTVTSTEGVVEALAGTKVSLSVVSTEELRSASLSLLGARIEMSRSGQPTIWQGEFVVQASGSADLEMMSSGGLSRKLDRAITIRAQGDREPLVRLIEPADDLRLHARAMVGLRYEAMDDFGITSLSVAVRVNSSAPASIPMQRRGDPRRIEGQCLLDLATLNVDVGDVVTVMLSAQDGAGHKVHTGARRILVSPRSIDINTQARIAELKQAAGLAGAASARLESTTDALEAARRTDGMQAEYLTARTRAGGSLAGAVEASLLLHQSLLRICAKSGSPGQTTALGNCVDGARVLASACERLSAAEAGEATELVMIDQVRAVTEASGKLAGQIGLLSEGEQASAILADQGNLRAPPASQPADAMAAELQKETVRRARQEVDWAVEELGLKASGRDLESKLQRKVQGANALVESCRPIDFRGEAARWTAAISKGEAASPLPERLASAASVEILRPDADPIGARDLQLAGRGAEQLGRMVIREDKATSDGMRQMLAELPGAIGALQREQAGRRSGQPGRVGQGAIAQEAAAARTKLAGWVEQSDLATAGGAAADLAMEASARTARREYDPAERIDQRLASGDTDAAAVQIVRRTMESVRQIDRVSQDQQIINQQTAAMESATEQQAQRLSQEQRKVAEGIQGIGKADEARVSLAAGADWRQQATSALQQIQAELAHMPQQLASAQLAAERYRRAGGQVEEARAAAGGAAVEQQAAAQRAVEQAMRGLAEAEDQLRAVGGAMSAAVADEMTSRLRALAGETTHAADVISEQLAAALRSFGQTMYGSDATALERSAARVRAVIEASQVALREAQGRIIESDPLVVARWYAESAAAALSQRPPDLPKARGQQQTVSLALGSAWQSAVRESAAQRMALVPGFGAIVAPGPTPSTSAGGLLESILPGMRQWGLPDSQRPESLHAPLHETEPPGYREALRIYFNYLSKSQEQAGKK